MKGKLEKIRILTDKLGIPLIEAKVLADQFDNVDAIIESWEKKQDVKSLTKLEERKAHFDRYGHYLFNLKEEHKSKVHFINLDFCEKTWKEYFVKVDYPDDKYSYMDLYDLKPIHTENATGNEFYDIFSKEMQSLLGWKKDATVYYFNGPSNCTKSEWGIVCEYWIPSIYEGNYNLILNPDSKKFLMSIEYETLIGEKKHEPK